jgi:hypothetical protein
MKHKSSKHESKTFVLKEFKEQTERELFCEIAACLGYSEFLKYCEELNLSDKYELSLLERRIADTMQRSPFRELLAALKDMAEHIWTRQEQAEAAPIYTEVIAELSKAAAASRRLANLLEEDNGFADEQRPYESTKVNGIKKVKRKMPATTVSESVYPEPEETPAPTWHHPGPAANVNILCKHTEQAGRVIFACEAATSMRERLIAASQREACRLLALGSKESQSPHEDNKLQAGIQRMYEDIVFLYEAGAFGRPLQMLCVITILWRGASL